MDQVAGRWFGVRAELERVGIARRMWRGFLQVVLSVVTVGISLDEWSPKRLTDVVVYRHDTGETVVRYRYRYLGPATAHVQSLLARLGKTHVFDFCRELGIDIGQVVGEGADEGAEPELTVVERPTSDDRPVW
jgi:hypothetical protein